MKRAKIALITLFAIAIAGSALTFKTKKSSAFELYGCSTQDTHVCDLDLGAVPGCLSTNGTFSICDTFSPNNTISCTSDCDCGTFKYNSCAIPN